MTYIVLDMEWNQPAPGVKLEYENDRCLCNEIIQIGAVKLDEALQIVDMFDINIKPRKFKHVNRNVRKLTGIDDAQLAGAVGIEDAIAAFRKWCGTDFVFITWGYDDIGVLGSNLTYFRISTDWLPKFYNLQMIFCAQTENLNKQYSLAYAAEHFGIALDKPLHNALTDAYYTAKVCAALDLKKGIDSYSAMVFRDRSIPEHMKNIRYKRSYRAVAGYEDLLKSARIKEPVCCVCEQPLVQVEFVKNGDFQLFSMGTCPEHGDFAEMLKVNKTGENLYCATEMYFAVDGYNREYFVNKAKKMRLSENRRLAKTLHKRKNPADKKAPNPPSHRPQKDPVKSHAD